MISTSLTLNQLIKLYQIYGIACFKTEKKEQSTNFFLKNNNLNKLTSWESKIIANFTESE